MSHKNYFDRADKTGTINIISTTRTAQRPQKDELSGRLVESRAQEDFVTERHYGCYRLGLAVALVIVLILCLGCVPLFITTENNKLILVVLIITLIIVGILTFAYFEWQRRLAIKMRQNSVRGAYSTVERRNQAQKYASVGRKEQDDKKPVTNSTKYSPV